MVGYTAPQGAQVVVTHTTVRVEVLLAKKRYTLCPIELLK